MKLIPTLLIVLTGCGTIAGYSQAKNQTENKTDTIPAKSTSVEMKQYFFVMLTKGAERSQDSITAEKIQQGHMNNISRLAKDGKLLVAGPFGDDGSWRGIFILDCKTREEAESLLKSDPAVSSGRLSYEIHPWWTAKNCVFK